ncbi:MAG TPA: shikimate dehydrogenase, partial [Anaerolineae bacterium]|nr:shikimate dehydrogenase [Anaerolineae bacterium]
MDAFAFIIHPLSAKRDVARKYPLLGRMLPEPVIDFASRFWPPVYISHVTGVRSAATGKEIEGWLLAVPYTVQRMLHLPPTEVYRKIIAAGRMAERLGAQILGLGAYTSVVGDGGVTIARALDLAVTSGDSYTAALAIRATREAMRRMEYDPAAVTLAVVGAAGAIGSIVTQSLAREFGSVLLVGRELRHLEPLSERLRAGGAPEVRLSTEVADIQQA